MQTYRVETLYKNYMKSTNSFQTLEHSAGKNRQEKNKTIHSICDLCFHLLSVDLWYMSSYDMIAI